MELHGLVIRRVGEERANRLERLGTCKLQYCFPKIKEVQGVHYMMVREPETRAEKDLECSPETITLE